MKVFCKDDGCHFPEEFEDSLKCSFWTQRGLSSLSNEYKKILWDWGFALPYDEILLKENIQLSVSWYGEIPSQPGNQFENEVPGYKKWDDKKRRKFQKGYFKFLNNTPPKEQEKIILDSFLKKYKKG